LITVAVDDREVSTLGGLSLRHHQAIRYATAFSFLWRIRRGTTTNAPARLGSHEVSFRV
jgi:hypothetical protein